MDEDLKRAIAQIKAYEAAATPGPWVSNGTELYYGPMGGATNHQSIWNEADARLIAVQRTWLMRIIEDLDTANMLVDEVVMEFKRCVESILVSEHSRTPDEAAALAKKHTRLVAAGIMRGLDTQSVTITATAIELAESEERS